MNAEVLPGGPGQVYAQIVLDTHRLCLQTDFLSSLYGESRLNPNVCVVPVLVHSDPELLASGMQQ